MLPNTHQRITSNYKSVDSCTSLTDMHGNRSFAHMHGFVLHQSVFKDAIECMLPITTYSHNGSLYTYSTVQGLTHHSLHQVQ